MAGKPDVAASQAVGELKRQVAALALENARLARENERQSGELQQRADDLRQSREYQAAIGEVLTAISRSTVDLAPVLQTLTDTALRLCEAEMGFICRRDGDVFVVVTAAGATPEIAADAEDYRRYQAARPFPIDRGSVAGRVALAGGPVQIPDIAADLEYRLAGATALGKIRSQVGVPLVREGALVGVLILARQRVEPFSERQVGLLRTFADQAVIAMENARLLNAQREALEQQQATSEILQIINSSLGQVAPVFDALLEKATSFCEAAFGILWTYDGARYHAAAFREVPPAYAEYLRNPPPFNPRDVIGRIAEGESVVHIADPAARTLEQTPLLRHAVELGGFRTILGVALRKEGTLLGAITIYRQEIRLFSDKQVSLLENFAAQAVIAIDNARLLGELRESLDQQTATSEILQVINASPSDLAPVFEAMLDRAVQLSDSAYGIMNVWEDGKYRAVALRGVPQGLLERWVAAPTPGPRNALMRIASGEDIVHIEDLSAYESYRLGDERTRALVETGGARSLLAVALRKEGVLLGVLTAYRQEVRPFTDKQITLLQGFAAQAVIAMENARLLGELRVSLDQQTATSDVLKTISRSSTDLGEVLDTLLATVARLCRADQAYMFRRHGELHHLVAAHGVPAEGEAFIRGHPFRHERGTTSGRVAMEKRVVHIHDVMADPDYDYAEGQRNAGFRTMLGLPLLREDTLLGVFVLSRTTVDPFSVREIELASGFADQALIAIENARLFEELRDRQAELRVTLDNTGDGVVMFDADFRLASWNRNFQEMLDIPDAFVAGRPQLDDYVGLLARRGELGDGDPESIVASYRERATRQWSAERTRPDGRIIGVRNNPVPDGGAVLIYSDITERKRAEAAIAAARDAAEEALEQQTATAEILRAISESPTNVQPVLDAVVKAAVRFCGTTDAVIILREGDGAVFAAHEGPIIVPLGSSLPVNRETAGGRALQDGQTCHLPDIASLDPAEFAAAHRRAGAHGFRAALAAPLLRQNIPIGAVVLRKSEVGPFTPRQIELLETFAAQAVIAIENVRLFNDLRESLEQQTATADILGVISRSPTDVQPVLEAVTRAALRFCGAPDAIVILRDGDEHVVAAHEGTLTVSLGSRGPTAGANFFGQAMLEGRTRQIADIDALEGAVFPLDLARARQHKWRAAAAAPMMHGGKAIGCVVLRKPEPGLLSPRQIALLETFAAQAVIAIENVRLFTELKESLEQQTATADILSVISRSPTDVQPVLEAVTRAALRFCGAPDALVLMRDGDDNVVVAHQGTLGATLGLRRPIGANFSGQALLEGRTLQIADVEDLDPAVYAGVLALARQNKWRASAAAPMMHGGKAIGCVVLRKPEPGLLSPRQIALLETFAAQAVIAIENVRLFTELKESLEQQTATADVLKVIAGSPTDVQPVLDAVAQAAQRFCGATDAIISLREGDEFVRAAHEGSMPFVLGRNALDRSSVSGCAIVDSRTTHVPDIAALDREDFATTQSLAVASGARAALAAPMLREGVAIGSILLRKANAGPFAPKQIELLEAFAAQAVIAIENVRLFTELRESLERQTATADILKVIASSPADTKPAFDAIAGSANRLLGGLSTAVWRLEGDAYHLAAFTPTSPAADEALKATSPLAKAVGDAVTSVASGTISEITDTENASPWLRDLARLRGYRAILFVPLMVQDTFIGFVSVTRREPGAIKPDDVQLLKTFADQAVIAIQNARLFNELNESLEQQTATGDILKAIASSPTDVQPVLDAVAKAAVRFCGTTDAIVQLRDGNEAIVAAHEGPLRAKMGQRRPIGGDTTFSAVLLEGRTIHYPDVQALDAAEFATWRQVAAEAGWRAFATTPLLREGIALGCISLRRVERGSFTRQQIELLKTFAAQAVIAIENVRLFTELRESLERLKAAQANLVQSEKMASLGQLTAGIAHEIKNPLNFVNNFAALSVDLLDELKQAAGDALATLDDDKRSEVDETMDLLTANLGKIAEHGRRADGIVRSMLSHSRGGSGDWTPCDINALVEEALNLAYHGARAQDNEFNVTLERDFAGTPRPIEVVPQDVTRVFLNLFGNGFYALGKRRLGARQAGFRPTLKVSTRDLGEAVEVRVRDNGTGIPPDVREKLFQPFFTTKPTGEGTGLGLSISYDIVTQQHGGTIEVESEPGSFTEFTVRLPRRRVQTSERV